MERVWADYLVETPFDLETAVATLAGEQSSGTFVTVPGETEELKSRFAAQVESIHPLKTVAAPSLPVKEATSRAFQQAQIRISWSLENFGYNLPNLVSTLQGNLYELAQFSGLRLLDIGVPYSFTKHFRGPRFGVTGCRKLTSVYGRPLIGTIVKPSIGLTPEETAQRVEILAKAGIDFIKDDELLGSSANSHFEDRVEAVMRVIRQHADRTGKKVMYAFNVSGEMDEMLRRYERVVQAGGTCVMVSLNSVGLAGVKKICDQGVLAIHGHRNGWGMLNRHPLLGMEFKAYQKIWRLAGVDQIHVNGIANKFWESDDSVVQSMEACAEPLLEGYEILPVVSSGQWGGQAFETYRRVPSIDLLYMAGGGIMAHPTGPASGVRALQQAWNGAVKGMTLEQTAEVSPEFSAAALKFGKKKERP